MSNALYPADLHCHTTASDGSLTPSEIVSLAKNKNLKALAITDHDTVDGLDEAYVMAKNLGVQLINGIEINTNWQGKEVHILGYEIDKNSSCFNQTLKEIREKRIIRIHCIIEKLGILGIDISLGQIMETVSGESLGRPHLALALVKKGYAETVSEAFNKYLKNGAPAYVPRYKLNPAEAIHIIRQAGGVAVLAHPGSEDIDKEIPSWVKGGLQGIEVSHPDHSVEDCRKYAVMAQEMNLLSTGGSDFHGKGIKPEIEIGNWGVTMDSVEKIFQVARENRYSSIQKSEVSS